MMLRQGVAVLTYYRRRFAPRHSACSACRTERPAETTASADSLRPTQPAAVSVSM